MDYCVGIKDLPLHSCCVHSMSFSTISRQAELSETIVGFCVDVADGLPPHSQLCHKVSQIEHLAPAHGSSLTGSPAASTSAASAAPCAFETKVVVNTWLSEQGCGGRSARVHEPLHRHNWCWRLYAQAGTKPSTALTFVAKHGTVKVHVRQPCSS